MPLDLFSKTPLFDNLPLAIREPIDTLKHCADKQQCLERAYQILAGKYHGDLLKTYTRFWLIFERDLDKLWNRSGFMHCANVNYLLRTLLVKSGFFVEADIRLRWTLVWYFSPHQYLQAKIGDKWINVDIWGGHYGIKLGDYAHNSLKIK